MIKPTLRNIISNLSQYWEGTISREIKELIDGVTTGKTEAIVSRTTKTLTVHIYKNHTTLTANKIRNNNKGITTQIRIKGIKGTTTEIPNIFKEIMNNEEEYKQFERKVLTPEQMGFAKTDEGVDAYGRPVMITAHLWQAVVWMLLYPGEIYVNINGIDINKNSVTIKWYLNAYNYSSLKTEPLNVVKTFDETALFNFMFTAILGDGDVTFLRDKNRIKPIIRLSLNPKECDDWEAVFNALKSFGINLRTGDSAKGETQVRIRGSNAIKLARMVINTVPPIIKTLLDALNADKWIRLKQMANMELGQSHKRGISLIKIGDIGLSVSINDRGYVTLRLNRRNEEEINKAKVFLESLGLKEDLDYGVRPNNGGYRLIIYHETILRNEWLRQPTLKKLHEMMERAGNNEKRRRKIMKAIQKLSQDKQQ